MIESPSRTDGKDLLFELGEKQNPILVSEHLSESDSDARTTITHSGKRSHEMSERASDSDRLWSKKPKLDEIKSSDDNWEDLVNIAGVLIDHDSTIENGEKVPTNEEEPILKFEESEAASLKSLLTKKEILTGIFGIVV